MKYKVAFYSGTKILIAPLLSQSERYIVSSTSHAAAAAAVVPFFLALLVVRKLTTYGHSLVAVQPR